MSSRADFGEPKRDEAAATPKETPLLQPATPVGSESVVAEREAPSWEKLTESHCPLPLPPAEIPSLDCPSQVGPYPIKGKVGAGGIGVVLRGYDAEFNRSLAVKLLQYRHKNSLDLATRFLEEAQIMGQLQHPNIPPVHHLGTTGDGRPYFSMKLIKGNTLAQLLKERPSAEHDLPRFVGLFENVCKALAYAHSRGIIHRDLKPENVMVGSFDELYVMDWGMARVAGAGHGGDNSDDHSAIITARGQNPEALTRAGMGTVGFMPPEQILSGVGGADARSDVFGLGAILCVILTGAAPYRANSKKELLDLALGGQLCEEALARLDQCQADAELVALARRCLAPRREDRPAHAGELADAITRYQASVQERRRQLELTLAQEQVKRLERRKQRRLVYALALLGFCTLGVITVNEWAKLHMAQMIAAKEKKIAQDGIDHFATDLRENRLEAALERLPELTELVRKAGSMQQEQSLELLKDDLSLGRELNKLQATLAAISINRAQAVGEPFVERGLIERAYEEVQSLRRFKEGETTPNLKRLSESSVSAALYAALHDWASVTSDPNLQKRLHALLDKANPEFAQARNLLRTWKQDKDLDQVKKLLGNKVIAALLVNEYKFQVLGGAGPLPGLADVIHAAPNLDFSAYIWLGNAGLKTRQFKEAESYFKLAARHPVGDRALALNNLACVQFYLGRFDEARRNLDSALDGAPGTHSLRSVLEGNRKTCNQYAVLNQKLEFLVREATNGQLQEPQEGLKLADLCFHRQLYLASATFARSAFEQSPGLLKEPGLAHIRLQAVRAAVLAAGGQCTASQKLDAPRKSEWLKWTRTLLQSELQALAKPGSGVASPRSSSQVTLRQWLTEPDLDGVRTGGSFLVKMPPAERQAWDMFWADVDKLLRANGLSHFSKQ